LIDHGRGGPREKFLKEKIRIPGETKQNKSAKKDCAENVDLNSFQVGGVGNSVPRAEALASRLREKTPELIRRRMSQRKK